MKTKQEKLLFMLFVMVNFISTSAQQILTVKDILTKEPIQNAVVIINGIFKESDLKGEVKFNLTEQKYPVKIKHISYHEFNQEYDFNTSNHTIYLKSKEEILDEATVNGKRKIFKKTAVANTIDSKSITRNTSANLGELLAKVEGVSFIKSGSTVVKPVIHGMTGNRIVILNNGVVQQGQDWSDEHAPEIDLNIANKISIIKNSEGIKYGPGSIGGVVLIKPKELPYSNKKINGVLSSTLSSNNNGSNVAGMIESNLFNNKTAWRIQGSKQNTADTKTAKYPINNTGTKSLNFSGSIGYKTKNIGIESYYSQYHNTYGVFYNSHIGDQDRLYIGYPEQTFKPSYKINYPKQDVKHHLFKTNSFWKNSKKGKFKIQYAYQFNNRKEFSVRRKNRSKLPAVHTELTTHNLVSNYQYKWSNFWKTEVGINYQNQINYNTPGTGIVPLLPNFTSIDLGGYLIQEYKKDKLELSTGIRYDFKTLDVAGIDRFSVKYGKYQEFKNFIYSISGSYKFNNQFNFKSNLGVAWRAPHVSELYSNGLHHESRIYIYGDKNLKSEQGIKWINSFSFHTKKVHAELSGFTQLVNNYIYMQPTQNIKQFTTGEFFVFEYRQTNGFFRGADINLGYNFYKNFEYTFKGSVLYANKTNNESYFPFIAPENFEHGIEFKKEPKNNIFSELYFSFNHKYVAKQTRFDDTSDIKKIPPPNAYHLFGISAGFTSSKYKNKQIAVHLVANNLFDKLYKDYTNRFRYYAHDLGRNIQLKTIINF